MQNGYVTHPISCKDWELRNVTEAIGDGDLIDLGADGSFVLHNAIKKGIAGRKTGIDLIEVVGDNKAEGAEYFKGDLQATGLPDNSFDTVVSLSTIEHQVDFKKFADEVSRLLRVNGNLYVSFDYFNPRPDTSKTKLYSLDWNILDKDDVIKLMAAFAENFMGIVGDIDWQAEPVITPQYCSPADVSYSFGLFNFKKFK